MLENMEFKVAVVQVQATRRVMQQMPVRYNLTLSQQNEIEPICWFYGDAALGREYRHTPYVLCLSDDGFPFLWVPTHYDILFPSTLVILSGSTEVPHAVVK